jgi:oxygen-independent coproporphyrinogen-3 oxidase
MTALTTPLSLYIHIPFCIKKCRYCDFYSVPYNESLADDFISALIAEWHIVKQELHLDSARIATIFFGGGTPSVLSIKQWDRIHKEIIAALNIAPNLEWTIECNPDSFTNSHAHAWLSMGVTRLTFGIQSLSDRELALCGRPHNAAQARDILSRPILDKFDSIGADLMYGLPGQTLSSFEDSINDVCRNSAIQHLSAYELTIAKNTCFGRHPSLLPLPTEDMVCDMAALLFAKNKAHGFHRYEISNFAKHGHECNHNKVYWNHLPYIGLGPSAHSYFGNQRFANTKHLDTYLSKIKSSTRPIDFWEQIDSDKLMAEILFLRLRTTEGLDETDFFSKTNEQFYGNKRKLILDDLQNIKFIVHDNSKWILTNAGMFLADGIAKQLNC